MQRLREALRMLTTMTVSGMWFSTASIIVLCCSATKDTCRHAHTCFSNLLYQHSAFE